MVAYIQAEEWDREKRESPRVILSLSIETFANAFRDSRLSRVEIRSLMCAFSLCIFIAREHFVRTLILVKYSDG